MIKYALLIENDGPQWRYYHTKKEISKYHCKFFDYPFKDKKCFDEYLMSSVGFVGAKIAKDLFKIDGIETIGLQPFRLLIQRQENFHWEEINDDVIKVLKEILETIFGYKESEITIGFL